MKKFIFCVVKMYLNPNKNLLITVKNWCNNKANESNYYDTTFIHLYLLHYFGCCDINDLKYSIYNLFAIYFFIIILGPPFDISDLQKAPNLIFGNPWLSFLVQSGPCCIVDLTITFSGLCSSLVNWLETLRTLGVFGWISPAFSELSAWPLSHSSMKYCLIKMHGFGKASGMSDMMWEDRVSPCPGAAGENWWAGVLCNCKPSLLTFRIHRMKSSLPCALGGVTPTIPHSSIIRAQLSVCSWGKQQDVVLLVSLLVIPEVVNDQQCLQQLSREAAGWVKEHARAQREAAALVFQGVDWSAQRQQTLHCTTAVHFTGNTILYMPLLWQLWIHFFITEKLCLKLFSI